MVLSAADVAPVPEGLDLIRAATVPLNALAAEQILDLLGDVPVGANRLLVTGAAGTLGGYLLSLAPDRGWDVTGLARTDDETFVRSLGAAFTDKPESLWDAVADAAALQRSALALVRDGGNFVGVQPGNEPTPERQIAVTAVITNPDGARLADLLTTATTGGLPTRYTRCCLWNGPTRHTGQCPRAECGAVLCLPLDPMETMSGITRQPRRHRQRAADHWHGVHPGWGAGRRGGVRAVRRSSPR